MNKKILKEIKLIEKFLLKEGWADLFKEFGVSSTKEAKSLFKDIKSSFAAIAGADAKALSNFENLVKAAKELTPAEKDALKASGKDVRKLVQEFDAAVKAKDAAKINSLSKELESATVEAKNIKGGKAPAPSSVPSVGSASAEPGVRALSKEQQSYLARLEKDMSSADAEISATAKKKYKEIMYPEIATQTGVSVRSQKEIAQRIKEIKDEMKTLEGAEKYGARYKELEKELEQLTGTGFGAKLKNWCVNNKKTCGILGLVVAGGTAYGIHRAGQAIGVFDPSPTPTPNEGGGGGKGGGKGGICHGSKTPKECSDLSWGCGGPTGTTGDKVREVQQKLIDCGYRLPKYGVDGLFCTETSGAVKKFQADNNLTANGIVDSATMDAISKCNTKTPDEPTPQPAPTPPPKPEEKIEKFGGEMQESLRRRRYNEIEKLVFERLVKGCK